MRKLLEIFQGLWDLYFLGLSRGEGGKVSEPHLAVIHERIAHIGDANARALLEQVESALGQVDIIESVDGVSRTVIVRVATRTGHDVAGAVLRGESIPNPPSELAEYTAAMDEHWSVMD